MSRRISKTFLLYLFAYKYILKVNCSFALPALSIYVYVLFYYPSSKINSFFLSYLISASQVLINGTPSDRFLVNLEELAPKFLLLQNIMVFFAISGVTLLYIFIFIFFVRDFSSRHFVMKRSGKFIDDIGFAITFCSLTLLFNYLLAVNINGWVYFLVASFVQCSVFLFLFKNQAYGYSIKERSRKIIT